MAERQVYAGVHPEIACGCIETARCVTDVLLTEMVDAFAAGALEALVRPSGVTENYAVPSDTWEVVHFPDRAFLSAEIALGHDGYWAALVGRTPFVRASQFDCWINLWVERWKRDAQQLSRPDQALRDLLFKLALNGVLTPDEAEQRARSAGLPALASRPSAERFDPMELPRRTLAQSVAWLCWGDVQVVREQMPEYWQEWLYWVPCRRSVAINDGAEFLEIDGADLVTAMAPSLTLLAMAEATNGDARETDKLMSVKSARLQLWQALTDGSITAVGQNADADIATIPAHEWSYLQLASDSGGSDYLVFQHDRLRTAYTQVTLARDGITSRWHSPLAQTPETETVNHTPRLMPPRNGKLEATRQALSELYPKGIPTGSGEKQRLAQVNSWHRRRGNQEVSLTTLRRAQGRM
jgi:hypothetical protein